MGKKKTSKKVLKKSYLCSNYENLEQISICQYGEIRSLRHKKNNNNEILAGKFVNCLMNTHVAKEFRIHVTLNHPNVLPAYEWFAHMKHGTNYLIRYKVLVMEYADGGTLFRHLNDRQNPFDKSRIPVLIAQITEGLAYIHDRGYIHRDIKTTNILISKGVAKIADFGLAVAVSSSKRYKRYTGVLGSAEYHAPEMLCGYHYRQNYDVWSLGVVITEMVLGRNIFNINKKEMPQAGTNKYVYCLRKILETVGVPTKSEFPNLGASVIFKFTNFPPLPPHRPYFLESIRKELGDDGHNFVYSCLTVAPRNRPTSQSLLQHAYLLHNSFA